MLSISDSRRAILTARAWIAPLVGWYRPDLGTKNLWRK